MTIYRCPACKAINSVRTSKSRLWERPLGLFGLHTFRCKACSKRFLRRWNISPKSLAQTAIAPAAPPIKNTSVPAPAIDSYPSLKVYTPESGSESLKAHASNPPRGFFKAAKPSHFLVGVLESPLGKEAMWVNLLSLDTLVGALLVFIDLSRARRTSSKAVGATVALVLGWAGLFFASELVCGFLLGPGAHGLRSDIALYREQSPWIWMMYTLLPVSGTIGCSAYLFYRNRLRVRFLDC